MADPHFNLNMSCTPYAPALRELVPHAAALGLRVYTGSMFPQEYSGSVGGGGLVMQLLISKYISEALIRGPFVVTLIIITVIILFYCLLISLFTSFILIVHLFFVKNMFADSV
jgi:hypothetical protein